MNHESGPPNKSACYKGWSIYIKVKSLQALMLEGSPVERGRPPTLPHCIAVPSAQAGLTSLFGMGRGGTPPP